MTLREFWERYGVTLAIVAAVALLFVALPGNAERPGGPGTAIPVGPGQSSPVPTVDDDGPVAIDRETTDSLVVDAADPGALENPGGAVTRRGTANQGAGPAQRQPDVILGQGPCRGDGRMAGISRYMPPCLRWVGNDNGGRTYRGVDKDKVTVVRYVGDRDPATQAILEGAKLADPPAVVKRAYDTITRYHNLHYETYGREVVLVDVKAGGPLDNDEAMRADAIRIVNDYRPLAVINGDPAGPVPKVLAQELAARDVICICLTSLSSQFYNENKPYIFSSLPTSDEYAIHVAEYVGKRLAGRNAIHAGDEFFPPQNFRQKRRVFGLIYIEGASGRVDPEGKRFRDRFIAELARNGVLDCKRSAAGASCLGAEYGYTYDPGRNQQDITTMIAVMKDKGVTSVIPIVDPLSPIIITKEASNQQYYPEWIQTGTGLSDTTTAGRLYDQAQWRHSFGISPLWVTWTDVRKSEGYREYHHARPGSQPGDEGVLVNIYRATIQALFIGIHMAGPNLTPDTFAKGMFSYPRTGGTPGAPLVYLTRQYPTGIKDFTEIFYAYDERGKDERGEEGVGMILKVDKGRRYQAGQWPTTDPKVFVKENAVATSDNPEGGGPPDHEQDGHTHDPRKRCLSCS